MLVISFDIGKKNFAFYIEELNPQDLKFDTVLKNRFNVDKSPTEEYQQVLETFFKSGERKFFANYDLTKGNKDATIQQLCEEMNNVLDENEFFIDKVDVVLIEKQMSFGKAINLTAIKLAQHCMSYFVCKYGNYKQILEFPAYHKTQVLGCAKVKSKNGKYKTIDKPARKKWCIMKALDIFELRNDTDGIILLDSHKKKDDLADTLCQLQAWKLLEFYK